MQNNSELEDLKIRLKNVIVGTCNTVGCENCGLKWDDGCSATELDCKIMDIEMGVASNEN